LVLVGPTDLQDAQQMHAIKVRTVRVGFNWREIERRQGVYRWWRSTPSHSPDNTPRG
jgi:hypothetical protein